MPITVHETDVFETWLDENNVFHSVVKPNSVIELRHAIENTLLIGTLSENKLFPILVDLQKIGFINKEARDHFAMRNRAPGVSAIALLIKSPGSRIIGNFFLGLNKPSVPTKLFTDRKAAETWLKQFVPTTSQKNK